MQFHPFSFENHATSRSRIFDAGARLLAKTGDNLGNTNRRAGAMTSRNLASEAERSAWRSIW
jgi:hypothetical protein